MAVLRTSGPSLSVVPSEAKGVGEHRVTRRDDEILEAVRRGDAVVAEDFYWRIKPVVDRTVRRLIGRLDRDGEDLVQIALVQLIESLPAYRGECPLDAWVSAVAAHVVYKHIRRRRLERNIFESALDGEEELSASQKTPGHRAKNLAARRGQAGGGPPDDRPAGPRLGLRASRRLRLFPG